MGHIKTFTKRLKEFYILKIYRYKFNINKHSQSFLSQYNSTASSNNLARYVVYSFWTGENKMSEDRKKCFDSMKNIDIPIKLITPNNIQEYVLDDHPLHEAYDYLSLVHKSDYLRCYFMHHYGGGYADIKYYDKKWHRSFSRLNKNSNKWCIGYNEINKNSVAPIGGTLGKELRKFYPKVIGNCSYIFKAKTAFTDEWINELHKRLDKNLDILKLHPGNTMGDNEGYPLKWTEILGDIFHPLCLKYSHRIIHDNNLKACFNISYR